MRGDELLNKMELIDPAYIESADSSPTAAKHRPLKWVLLAACVCLLAGSVAAMAVQGFGTRLLESFTLHSEPGEDYEESGFRLHVEIEKISPEALHGKIAEAPARIREQYAAYLPHMSHSPGHWQVSFASRSEAYDYIGFKGLNHLPWNLAEEYTSVSVHGTENGDILFVTAETLYLEGDIHLQFYANLYTENWEDAVTLHTATTEYAEFSESFHTTSTNKTLHVIECSALKSGYRTLDGYMVENDVLYQLHIAYRKKDESRARELLHEWAELF